MMNAWELIPGFSVSSAQQMFSLCPTQKASVFVSGFVHSSEVTGQGGLRAELSLRVSTSEGRRSATTTPGEPADVCLISSPCSRRAGAAESSGFQGLTRCHPFQSHFLCDSCLGWLRNSCSCCWPSGKIKASIILSSSDSRTHKQESFLFCVLATEIYPI